MTDIGLVDGTVYRGMRIEVYETSVGSFRYITSISVSGSGYSSKEEASEAGHRSATQ